MREDTDVIAVARKGKLAELVTMADLKGDTHVHSDWTDGVDSIEVMARAARARGQRMDGADRSLAVAGRDARADARIASTSSGRS